MRIGPGLRGTPQNKAFYQSIKALCPETVFHGTDVGHQSETTGARYLEYLREQDLEDSEPYRLTLRCIEQGQVFAIDFSSKTDGTVVRYYYRSNGFVWNGRPCTTQFDPEGR